MKFRELLKNGIVDENPVFVKLIALCPLLAVSTSAINGVAMGLCTTAVMICASAMISMVRKFLSPEIRIASFVIIIASFVIILELLMQAYAPPAINDALGIYVPLIVVNCILFARVEAFAYRNKVLDSAVDALGMGLGFTLGCMTVGIVREILGSGSIFGIQLIRDSSANILIMIMSPGAFFTLGGIIMVRKYINAKKVKD